MFFYFGSMESEEDLVLYAMIGSYEQDLEDIMSIKFLLLLLLLCSLKERYRR